MFISAPHISIFLYTAPVFTALGLHLFAPEERLTAIQWLGIAIAFPGIVVTFACRGGPDGEDHAWIGDIIGHRSRRSMRATTIVVRTTRLASKPATVTLRNQLFGAGLLAASAALLSEQTTIHPATTMIANLGYQTPVISMASHLAWFVLLRNYLASRLDTPRCLGRQDSRTNQRAIARDIQNRGDWLVHARVVSGLASTAGETEEPYMPIEGVA